MTGLWLTWLLLAPPASTGGALSVGLAKTVVRTGEPVVLSAEGRDGSSIQWPDFGDLEVGVRSQRSQVTMRFGETVRSVTATVSLRAPKAGTYTIGPVQLLRGDDVVAISEPLTLVARGPAPKPPPTGLRTDPERPWAGQPFRFLFDNDGEVTSIGPPTMPPAATRLDAGPAVQVEDRTVSFGAWAITEPGTVTLGPVEQSRPFFAQPVMATLPVEVRPLPKKARYRSVPAGQVGTFQMVSEARTVTPGTYELVARISGQGNIPALAVPLVSLPRGARLAEPELLSRKFDGRTLRGEVVYSWTLTVPPRSVRRVQLRFPHFDPKRRAWRTLRSRPKVRARQVPGPIVPS